MKKFIYLILVTVSMHNSSAMDAPRHNQGKPEESGYNFFGFTTELGTWFASAMNDIDQAVGGNIHQENEQDPDAAHMQFVRDEIAKKPLSLAILDAAQEDSSAKFISLLIGMKRLAMEPTQESKTIIKQHLNVLHLERRQVTRDMLEDRMSQEREIHALRKQFKSPEDQISDDEDYTRSNRFADKLLSDE